MKIHRVVLVGAQGQGKTTFFNSITNQNQETTYAGSSCTRQIVQSQTVYGQGFEVIDTPGFDSSENKLLHISGILAALTFGKVNRILIVTKYERNDSIIKNQNQYRSIVTVIFTHWDFCVKGQEEKETIRIKELIEKKFKIVSFLFFSKTKDPEITCQQIEAILLSETQEENIKLFESEIYKYFDILELDCDNADKMSDHLRMILQEFRKISQAYIKFINQLKKENPYFLSILHEITLLIKEEANHKVEEFEKKNGEEILEMVDIQNNNLQYLHYIYLKKEIRQDIEQVIDLASKRMRESKIHIFNYLKKCPFCGLIWLKVIGCDGETKCGNAVNSKTDGFLYVQPKRRIKIIRNQNNEFDYQVNENNSENENYEFLEQLFIQIVDNKPLDEKKNFLDQIESILISLYEKNYKDKLIELIIKGDLTESQLKSQIERKISEESEKKITRESQNLQQLQQPQPNMRLTIKPHEIQKLSFNQQFRQSQLIKPTKLQSKQEFQTFPSQLSQAFSPPPPPIHSIQVSPFTSPPQFLPPQPPQYFQHQVNHQNFNDIKFQPIPPFQPSANNPLTFKFDIKPSSNFQNQIINKQEQDQNVNQSKIKILNKNLKTNVQSNNPITQPFAFNQSAFNTPLFPPPLLGELRTDSFLFSHQNFEKQKDKSVGCGKKIVWKSLPPLTSDEISQLFSSELLEYFADQDKIEKEEIDWLDKTYKQIVNESILQAQNNILILKKNQIENKELIDKNQTQ